MRPFALLAAALTLAATPVFATTTSYVYHGSIGPGLALAISPVQGFGTQVLEGERFTVSLAWEDPLADLDLRVADVTPISRCYPSQVECVVRQTTERTCRITHEGELGAGPGEESVDAVAPATSDYRIVVTPFYATSTATPYTLTVTIDGVDANERTFRDDDAFYLFGPPVLCRFGVV